MRGDRIVHCKSRALLDIVSRQGPPAVRPAMAVHTIQRHRPVTFRAKTGSGRVDAYGSTIVLCPACSFRMAAEQSTLFSAFLAVPGFALLVRSECQPTTSTRGQEVEELAPMLSSSAQRMLLENNAGGSSRISEAMSLECLYRAFGARLLKTEMELRYWPSNGSITDYSIEVDNVCLGVSVTRAMGRPGEQYSLEAAEALLRKKLTGVLRSTETCMDDLRKQILHVWARTSHEADVIELAYSTFDPELISSTVVLVTVCNFALLFEEKSRSPISRCRPPKGLKDEAHIRVLQESDPIGCNCSGARKDVLCSYM